MLTDHAGRKELRRWTSRLLGAGARVAALGLAASLCLTAASHAQTDAPGPAFALIGATPGESFEAADRELILEVTFRGQGALSDAIFAVMSEDGEDVLLPLEAVAQLLEFAIFQTEDGAEGWYIRDDRTFELDLEDREIDSDEASVDLTEDEVTLIDGELFVSARRLAETLPLNLSVNLRSLVLDITPRELTPIDERRLRAERRTGALGQTVFVRSLYEESDTPYEAFSVPTLSFSGGLGYDSVNGLGANYTIRSYGDFVWLSRNSFITGGENGISNARLRLGRSDPRGGLLGPLDATAFEIGDVGGVGVPLINSSIGGRGFRITRRAPASAERFDRVTFEDVVEPNYEVELYRNDILIAAVRTDESGQYRFDDIPLLSGVNEFRLEFYGPRGERRTETERFERGSRARAGEFTYDMSVNQVGRSLFGFNDEADRYDDDAVGGVARFSYGFSENFAISSGFVAAPIPSGGTPGALMDGYGLYATIGARTQLQGVSLAADGAVDDNGGYAVSLTASTTFGALDLSFTQQNFFNDFTSQTSQSSVSIGGLTADSDQFLMSRSEARASYSSTSLLPGVGLGVTTTGAYDRLESGDDRLTTGADVSVAVWRFAFGNSIRYATDYDDAAAEVDGAGRLNVNLDPVALRASAAYAVKPDLELESFSVGVSTILPWETSLNVGYSHFMEGDEEEDYYKNFYLGLERDFGVLDLGLQGSYSRYEDERDDGYTVGVTVSFDMFTEDGSILPTISSEPIARDGAIRAVVFVDANRNGVFDHGEWPVEGARVYFGEREPAVTDSRGVAVAVGLRSGSWRDVAVDPTSLGDPLLQPAIPGRAVLPRPGVTSEVALPVVATGDISGSVLLIQGGGQRPLSNIVVQALPVDEEGAIGDVALEAVTEFDGVYYMQTLATGQYMVRIEPEQARRLGLDNQSQRIVVLRPGDGILENINLTAERRR